MEAFAQFGSDLDVSTQKLLARGQRLTELLKQPQFAPLAFEEQVIVIYSGVKGYLDKMPKDKVQAFEKDLLLALRTKYIDLLKTIREEQKISDSSEAQIKKILEDFVTNYK